MQIYFHILRYIYIYSPSKSIKIQKIMKKKLVVLSLAAVLAVSAFLFIQSRSDKQNDLLLANVEAFAGDENGSEYDIFCVSEARDACHPSTYVCYFWIVCSRGDIPCFFPNKESNL